MSISEHRSKRVFLTGILLSGFVIVFLIGVSGCSDRMDEDDKPEGPLVVRNGCLILFRASEAEILADRTLRLETDTLLFDPKKWRQRTEEMNRILLLIRGAYPEVANIPVFRTRGLGQLHLNLDPELYQILAEILATEKEFVTLKTGNAEFDALTTTLELQGITLRPPKSIFTRATLCFKEWVNTDVASDAYSVVGGVRAAMPAYTAGGGPDIVALKEGRRWFFIFRSTWENIPVPEPGGTLALFFFTVTGDKVQQTTEEVASTMSPFQKLLSTRSDW